MAKVKYKQNGSWLVVGGGGASGDYIEGEGIGKIFVSNAQPSSGETGDLWLDISSQTASGVAYLPLSAGSNYPLTGQLDIQAGGDNGRVKILQNTSGASFNYFDDGGIKDGGLYIGTQGRATVFGNGEYILLRPNGLDDSTGQVQVLPSGQVYFNGQITGGLGYYTTSDWTAATLAQYTWYNKCKLTLPVGRYLCIGVIVVKGAGVSNGGRLVCDIGNSDRSLIGNTWSCDLNYPTSNNGNHNYCIVFNNNANQDIYLWLDSAVANLGYTGATFYAIRIN